MNPIALLLLSLSLQNDQIHVSPSGNDTNAGTKDAPFATLTKAREAVRPLAGTKPVTVVLHGGTYLLSETLVFKPEDSGVTWTAAPGEKVVVSAGRAVTAWKKAEGGLWTAQV